MELADILAGLVGGTSTVPVVTWLLKQIAWQPNKGQRRTVAFVMSFVLGAVAFLLSVQLGYTTAPATLNGWFEALWPVAAAAFTASQAVLSAWRSNTISKLLPKKKD